MWAGEDRLWQQIEEQVVYLHKLQIFGLAPLAAFHA
ncbi:MAG: Uncharacterised protein [Rhodospirillaceae bacterium]|nr:MAG: Uncharacterised protein [Rhodospirillaceae bacterium]